MYDNVDLILTKDYTPKTDFLSEIPAYLENVNQHYFNNGNVSISGYIGNLKVSVSEMCVKIKDSSLCKYYLGDNFQTLSLSDTKNAIQKISDSLHLPFDKAEIKRIDIAQNIIVKHPESVYFSHFGQLQHFHRLEQPDGIYFSNSKNPKSVNQQLVFYKKVVEQKAKKQPIPELYKNRNVLRYEFRMKNRLKKQLKTNNLQASLLYNEKFYIYIIDKWKQHYFDIKKLKLININLQEMKNPNDFIFSMLIEKIRLLGGDVKNLPIEAYQTIENAKEKGNYKNRMQVSRLKSKITDIFTKETITVESDAIKELDKKINEAVKYYA